MNNKSHISSVPFFTFPSLRFSTAKYITKKHLSKTGNSSFVSRLGSYVLRLSLFILLFPVAAELCGDESSFLFAQEVIINDGTNSLVKITDEGTFGSIQLKNGTPANTARKIYSVGGTLYYNGNPVHSGGVGDNDWTIVNNDMYSNVSGFVGVNNTSPAYTLDVGGDINLTGRLFLNGSYGTPGQVLTTNGSSPPTWEDATGNSVGFHAYQTDGTVEYPGGAENQLHGFTENYDDGNGFNPTTGSYTPPSNGLYHFDVKVGYKAGPTVNAAPTYILVKVGGTAGAGQKLIKRIWITANQGESVLFSTNLKVTSTNAITFHFFFPSGNGLNIEYGNIPETTTISGFKVK